MYLEPVGEALDGLRNGRHCPYLCCSSVASVRMLPLCRPFRIIFARSRLSSALSDRLLVISFAFWQASGIAGGGRAFHSIARLPARVCSHVGKHLVTPLGLRTALALYGYGGEPSQLPCSGGSAQQLLNRQSVPMARNKMHCYF